LWIQDARKSPARRQHCSYDLKGSSSQIEGDGSEIFFDYLNGGATAKQRFGETDLGSISYANAFRLYPELAKQIGSKHSASHPQFDRQSSTM
jgi:hypothetical protein